MSLWMLTSSVLTASSSSLLQSVQTISILVKVFFVAYVALLVQAFSKPHLFPFHHNFALLTYLKPLHMQKCLFLSTILSFSSPLQYFLSSFSPLTIISSPCWSLVWSILQAMVSKGCHVLASWTLALNHMQAFSDH